MGIVALFKLDSVDAFVVRDLDDDVPAIGIVRSAPKILQSGAKDLARSQTYQCAVFNMRIQGASAGINAVPEDRANAISSFTSELAPLASNGALMLDAGKGVSTDQLGGLFEADPRDDALARDVGGIHNRNHLLGLGAVACAEAAKPLDGTSIAIENFDATGAAVAAAARQRGAAVNTISTTAGVITNEDGFDIDALTQSMAENGPSFIESFGEVQKEGWKLWGAKVDAIFAGSKAGVLNHQGAPSVTASLLVPTGPIPYTTKAAIMLERQGTTVLPDFVTTAGPLFGGMPPDGADQDSIEAAVIDLLGTLTAQTLGQEHSPVLEACHRAESFLSSWRDKLPFGRPFAS